MRAITKKNPMLDMRANECKRPIVAMRATNQDNNMQRERA